MVKLLKKMIMKNIVWIVIGVCSFFCYSTLMSTNVGKQAESVFNLSDVEALASGEELPELEIICGEHEGRCWDGECIGYSATMFGIYRSWHCDVFTGLQKDVCFNGVPC